MPISLDKVPVSLRKTAERAQFAISKYNLSDVTAKCAIVLDASISIANLYRNGTLQSVAEKVLAVATQFDDDGAIDVFFFHDTAWYAGELTLDDFEGGVKRLLGSKEFGGTNYASAIEAVTEHYFPTTTSSANKGGFFRRPKPSAAHTTEPDRSVPVYVAFITDGQTQDEQQALVAARDSSEYPIFFQFIGVGDPRFFNFIKDTMNNHGGKVDNTGFFTQRDIASMKDMELLDGLLNEFPGALDKMRAAGTLK